MNSQLPPGLSTIYTDAQQIVAMDCLFGNTFNYGHLTKLSMARMFDDNYWIGFVTSSFNQ